ncbi:MAG TPA: toluene tolerance protein [Chromatiaceae bacterium]|nr:toluene tolerance protein [Chromatiaceae bacterium]
MNRRIGRREYERLVEGAKVLESDHFGVKVWLRPDGRIVKLFRTKRLVSSARLYPYSSRFVRNARRLEKLGIRVPGVEGSFHCPQIRRHGVIYRLLPGKSLAELLGESPDATLVARLAAFLAELHEKGIYFRSVHPGNVLLTDDDRLGLIDLQYARFWPWPLGARTRSRNFRHLFHSRHQSVALRNFGFAAFVDLYLAAVPRPQGYRDRLRRHILAYEGIWKQGRVQSQ